MTPYEQIQEKIAAVEAALTDTIPGWENHLREIHRILKKDEELVTQLKEEEIAVIVQGLSKRTGIEIQTKAASKPRKALKQTTVDDL
jgi:hypothetical protein